MPAQQKAKAKGRKIGTRLAKCKAYRAAMRKERNRDRRADTLKHHLLMAKARRYRNHPDKATIEDAEANETLRKLREDMAKNPQPKKKK